MARSPHPHPQPRWWQPTPTYVVAPLPWQTRLQRWAWRLAGRAAWRSARGTARVGWRARRVLLPWYLAFAVWSVGALAGLADRGWLTVLAVGLLGAGRVWWWCGGWAARWTRRRGLKPRRQRAWAVAAYAVAVGCAVAVAGWRAGPPMPGIIGLAAAVFWCRWMWHYRVRPEPAVELAPELGDVERLWAAVKGMDGTTVGDIVEYADPKRIQFDVDLSATKLLVEDVVKAVPYIAKPFKVTRTSVLAGYADGGLEDLARVEIVEDNPCHEKVLYDESWIPTDGDIADGVVPFHLYPNGHRGRVRAWYPGAGTVMTMFSGDIGSGKSAGMSALLTQFVMTGWVWPLAACPQGGASMPEWVGAQGQARWKAACRDDDLDPIYTQLEFLCDVMDYRTDAMSELVWTDRFGDEQVGLGSWDPLVTGWPALAWAGDELWRMMLIPEFAILIKRLLKLGRKAGILMMVATQYPGIQEFNNDNALRQPLAAGNVLAYANADGQTKDMILKKGMPGPDQIPSETPRGEHTKGTLIAQSQAARSSLPQYARSVWAERGLHWAKQAEKRIRDLDPGTDRIRRLYLPNGHNVAVPRTQQDPERDVVTVTAPAAAAPARAGRETYADRVEAYLRTAPGGRAHSGVIATALDLPHPRVSEVLTRGEPKGRFHQARPGVWGLGRAARARAREMEGTAA